MHQLKRQSILSDATLLVSRIGLRETVTATYSGVGKRGRSQSKRRRARRALNELLRAVAITCSAAIATTSPAEEVRVNGTVLTYTQSGKGDAVLFVHGAITDMRAWEAYREKISKDYAFVAYTQRYFGTADWPDEGGGFQTLAHADDLIGLIEALDIAPVNLVSHSYSGMVSVHAILKRPELFRSVIHFEPSVDGVLVTLPGHKNAKREMSSNLSLAGAAIRDGRLEDASLRFFEALTGASQGMAETLAEPIPTMLRENGRTIPFFLKKDFAGLVNCSDLATLAMPTLVVIGQKTFTRYAMIAEQMARCQQNALLLTVPNARHTYPVTDPGAFANVVLKFLELLRPAK